MHAPPTQGVKGVKPRFKSAKEELPKLSKEYLQLRNRAMRAKALTAEMEGAARRGELLERKLVECQASYLLVCMRQRILRLPAECAPQLAGLTDVHDIRMALEGAARAVLEELANFPSKVTDPHWLEHIDDNGAPRESEEKPAQAKTPRRRHDSPK
jgi:hypothetical protein